MKSTLHIANQGEWETQGIKKVRHVLETGKELAVGRATNDILFAFDAPTDDFVVNVLAYDGSRAATVQINRSHRLAFTSEGLYTPDKNDKQADSYINFMRYNSNNYFINVGLGASALRDIHVVPASEAKKMSRTPASTFLRLVREAF